MKIESIIQPEDTRDELLIVGEKCREFLEESARRPLLKNLSTQYGDFHKVKVRKRKSVERERLFTETFNEAFTDINYDMRQRAIFANGPQSFAPVVTEELEPFYIFPIDGYKFLYSREVKNSTQDYKHVLDIIMEEFGEDRGNEVMSDLLKFSYTSENLSEGIDAGAEIVIYNIPYFYAIRASTVNDYEELLDNIEQTDNGI